MELGDGAVMNSLRYSAFLFLILLVSQVHGEDSVTLRGYIEASGNRIQSVWIGVFELPMLPGAEAMSWTQVSSAEFTFDVPDVDEIQIIALQKDFLPLLQRVNPRLNDARIGFEFQEGNTLEGVVRSNDDIPIPSAFLTVEREDLPNVQIPIHVRLSWASNADGRFKISGLVGNEEYKIDVSTQFVERQRFAVQMPKSGNHNRDLRLSDAYFVLGRVVDQIGSRAPDSTVTSNLILDRSSSYTTSTTTDAEGEFQTGPYPRGNEVRLSAKHQELGSSERLLAISGEHEVVLTLAGMVQVVGTVIDASTGERIDDFRLVAIQANGSSDCQQSGSNGEFSCLVDSATEGMIVDADEHIPHFIMNLNLKMVESYDMGVIALNRGRTLTGRVYDASTAEPIPGAAVSHFDSGLSEDVDYAWENIVSIFSNETRHSTTDAKGEYKLSRLPVDSTKLSVSADGYARQEIEVDAAVAEFDIPLSRKELPRSKIWGRVETDTGNPIGGTVYFVSETGVRGQVGVLGDGLFDYATKPDPYDVYAITDQGVSATVSVVLSEDEIREITLVVDSKGRLIGVITGLVDDETATLSVYTESMEINIRTLQGVANGGFVVDGLGIGAFKLSARSSHKRFQTKSFEVDVETGEAYVELIFSGNSRLYGTLGFPDGSVPKGEIWAVAKHEGQTSSSCSINSDGTYEILGLHDGEYTVHIQQLKKLTLDQPGRSSTIAANHQIHEVDVVVDGETEMYIEISPQSDSE